MKSASNKGALKGRLQVLHVHVLLVVPLGASHIAQPGTGQHQGRVSVRERSHHTGATANPPVQSLDDVVGTDMSSVFAGKSTVSQGFFDAVRPLIVFHDVKLKFDG